MLLPVLKFVFVVMYGLRDRVPWIDLRPMYA